MNTKEAKKALRAIARGNEAVGSNEEVFLKARGWTETCMTPGSYWLWTKRIEVTRGGKEPKTYAYDALCSRETAINLETSIVLETADE